MKFFLDWISPPDLHGAGVPHEVPGGAQHAGDELPAPGAQGLVVELHQHRLGVHGDHQGVGVVDIQHIALSNDRQKHQNNTKKHCIRLQRKLSRTADVIQTEICDQWWAVIGHSPARLRLGQGPVACPARSVYKASWDVDRIVEKLKLY